MQPSQCTECHARVQVQKNSWEHTSVQWDTAARSRCHELSGGGGEAARRAGAPRERCSILSEVIEDAARAGSVAVLDPRPVRPLGIAH
ncbi:hypothetical protein QEN35_00120 [Gordonia alkanivorans]|uniref:hypothetical protein n=1 Tax=Gordonia alkanivorans TaxID=84096 RepID=UPI002446973B|nr:hypothetical protein [Gordonia alkanivorans]MDH3022791.1 hypothetical protein [Gordonia alkanivorans]